MKKFILIFVIIIISVNLLNDRLRRTQAPSSVPDVPKYDFRDKQYQDFYSRFMRAQSISSGDHIDYGFTKEVIEETLGIEIEEFSSIQGRLNISRIDPNPSYIRRDNHLSSSNDLLALYKRVDNLSDFEDCQTDIQINGLFCLKERSFNTVEYFYFPDSNQKIPHINQSINFHCEKSLNNTTGCKLTNLPDYPYNLNIWIYFRNPKHFFYIISYVESYLYQTTGEHIWQTSLKQR